MIMVVDDNITNLKFAKSALAEVYDVLTVPSAAKMFKILESSSPAMIFLDIDMPETNGYEAIKILKADPATRHIPVIFLTGKNDSDSEVDGLSLGAVDYVTKPFAPNLLRKRVEIHLTMESQRRTLEKQRNELQNFNENLRQMVDEKTGLVFELQGAILATVADLVESRDDTTGGHVERTRIWLSIMVTALKDSGLYREEMTDWDMRFLLQSSQLHDVGKIAISDAILKKPGPLNVEEYNAMKLHTTFGIKIIEKIETSTSERDFLRHAKIFAGTHHEKWDGSGYPLGLRAGEIPLQGRLMAIVDVYDALISDRPYKTAIAHDQAVRTIIEERGRHFDPVLVDLFRRIEARYKSGSISART
jgi:putative two-component system response regulator